MKEEKKRVQGPEYQRALVARMKAAGLVQVAVWCSPELATRIKKMAARDRAAALEK